MMPVSSFRIGRGRRLTLPFLFLVWLVIGSTVLCADEVAGPSRRPTAVHWADPIDQVIEPPHLKDAAADLASQPRHDSSLSDASVHSGSDDSFRSATGSHEWASGSDASSPRSPNGFGRFDDISSEISEAGTPPSDASRHSFGSSQEAAWTKESLSHDDFVQPKSPNALQKQLAAIRAKAADARWKLRTHLSDLKDAIAVGRDRNLANYHTTGGVAALYGREDNAVGKTIPTEARRIAQELGQVHVFYDPDKPQNQVRVAYKGPLLPPGADTPVAPPEHFRAYIVPPNRALPLPKHWREQGLDETTRMIRTMGRMKDADTGEWRTNDIRDRWPATWDAKKAEWRAKVNGWRQNVADAPGRVREWYNSQARNGGADAEAEQAASRPSQQQGWKQSVTGAWNRAKARWSQPSNDQPSTIEDAAGPASAPVEGGARQAAAPRTWSTTLNNAVQRVKQVASTTKSKLVGWTKGNASNTAPTIITENAQDVVHTVHRRRRRRWCRCF